MTNTEPKYQHDEADLVDMHKAIKSGEEQGHIPPGSILRSAADDLLEREGIVLEKDDTTTENNNSDVVLTPEAKRIIDAIEQTNDMLSAQDAQYLIDTYGSIALEFIFDNIDRFEGLDHQALVNTVLAGSGDNLPVVISIIINIGKMPDVDQTELAKKIIERGDGSFLAARLENLNELDHSWLAIRLIEQGDIRALEMNIQKFKNLNNDVALGLIETFGFHLLVTNLDHFSGLTKEVALEVAFAGYFGALFKNYHVFKEPIFDKQMALICATDISGAGPTYLFVEIAKFQGLDQEVFEKLQESESAYRLATHIKYFNDLNKSAFEYVLIEYGANPDILKKLHESGYANSEMATWFIGSGLDKELADYLDYFSNLTEEIAKILIDSGYASAVIQNLNSFTSIDSNYLALNLFDNGDGFKVIAFKSELKNLDTNAIFELLKRQSRWSSILENIDLFADIAIDMDALADEILRQGHSHLVARYLNLFPNVNHKRLIEILFSRNQQSEIEKNLDKFDCLDSDIAYGLANAGCADAVGANVNKFKGLDQKGFAVNAITKYKCNPNFMHLERFDCLDTEIAKLLVDNGHLAFIVKYISRFSGLKAEFYSSLLQNDYGDLADMLLEQVQDGSITSTSLIFDILLACSKVYSTAQKIANILNSNHTFGLSQDQIAEILQAAESAPKPEFPQGVSEDNPYEPLDKYSPGGPQLVRIARDIGKMNRRPFGEDERLDDIRESLAVDVAESFKKLEDELKTALGEETAKCILAENYENGQSPLFNRYQLLVYQYLANLQTENDALSKLEFYYNKPETLRRALHEANEKFLQVLKIDIPYYDKLFLEWDTKRIGEKEFTEVFLGRDGVYAFIARQAQINTRRKKLGIKKAKASSWAKKPLYLVYPRVFRDGLSDEVKLRYLQDQLGEDAQSASFYDTGFTGSIPEDILRILGIDSVEMENRIRLLSATKRERTVIGLKASELERRQIVNDVEYNSKKEYTAEGVFAERVANPASDRPRMLEPYARPTSPEEQLAFAMIEQALRRYYTIKETQSQEAIFESVVLANSVEVRVLGSTPEPDKEMIEEIFGSPDIGNQLAKVSTAIKVSNPEDPYPNEIIFETKDSIIKKYATMKQQGTIDEFEALILLDKLRIDAPKPVARIYTGDDQEGFIVMSKIGGISGREIKKHIPDVGLQDFESAANKKIHEISYAIRTGAGIDKPWKLEDFMFEIEPIGDSGHVRIVRMIPIDFERVKIYDPANPCHIEGDDIVNQGYPDWNEEESDSENE